MNKELLEALDILEKEKEISRSLPPYIIKINN